MQWENASAARTWAAVGAGGPKRTLGCTFVAQAVAAARNTGEAWLIPDKGPLAPFELGSGKFDTPFARMQSAYLSACV
jgi:hypothetical protein